jgi:hypothetical protein
MARTKYDDDEEDQAMTLNRHKASAEFSSTGNTDLLPEQNKNTSSHATGI